MSFAVMIPSLSRPEKLAKTLSQTDALAGGQIFVGVPDDQANDYCRVLKEHKLAEVVALVSEPVAVARKGAGPARRWLALVVRELNLDADAYVFMDDDITFKAGRLADLVATVQKHSEIGLATVKDRAFWGFDPPQLHLDPTGEIRKTNRPMQVVAVRRDVFWKLGGFSSMPRGEDIDLAIRAMISGYVCVTCGFVRAAGEYWKRQGGMFEVESVLTGIDDPRKAAAACDVLQCDEWARKYPGLVKVNRLTGRWRFQPAALKRYREMFVAGKIRLDADTGIVCL